MTSVAVREAEKQALEGAGIVEAHERIRGPGSVARWRRVALSPRDWEILGWAHEQKFLTFDQVARWFPEGEPSPRLRRRETVTPDTLRRRERPGNWYLTERLRKLVRFGVLKRVPVFHGGPAALVPGRTGFDLLAGEGRGHGLSRLETIDWKTFAHDREVTDVRWHLQKALGWQWKSERVLQREWSRRQVPDAIARHGLELPGCGRRDLSVAVEVELTRKSAKRYREIIRRHLEWLAASSDRLVLYVVPREEDVAHFLGTILKTALNDETLWGIKQPDFGGFRFATREDVARRRVRWTVNTPWNPTEGRL